MTTITMASSLSLVIFFPQINTFLSLIGGFGCVVICYLVPSNLNHLNLFHIFSNMLSYYLKKSDHSLEKTFFNSYLCSVINLWFYFCRHNYISFSDSHSSINLTHFYYLFSILFVFKMLTFILF